MRNTKIEWCDDTINPWWGCEKVSSGCKHCYAADIDRRFHAGAHWAGDRLIRVDAAIEELRAVARAAKKKGRRRSVFMSMGDIAERHPALEEPRKRYWEVMHETAPHVRHLLLTKRPGHLGELVAALGLPEGAMVGTSVEDQKAADERIPHLLRIPARVRFLSCEPLLGPVDLTMAKDWPGILDAEGAPYFDALRGSTFWPNGDHGANIGQIHWVVAGGESGRNARPMHTDWVRSLRDQCAAVEVPFFFKQWGEWAPAETDGDGFSAGMADCPEDANDGKALVIERSGAVHAPPDPRSEAIRWWATLPNWLPEEDRGEAMVKLGKRAAGRLLDGVEHSAFPVLS